MINIIYYSKNRPMQLEASIRSLKGKFREYDQANKVVIFDASNANYVAGYRNLMNEYPEFQFVFQTVFQKNTMDALDTKNWFSMFVMDDIFFKEPFSLMDLPIQQFMASKDILTVSLRLGENIRYCYAIDNFMKHPKFSRKNEDVCVWNYVGAEGDWGYAYSLDGNIYQTTYIKSILEQISFSNPNFLEASLNNINLGPQYIASYYRPRLFNAPINRIQNTFENRHENSISAEQLNKLFLEGKRIKLENIMLTDNDAVHYPVELEFQ